MLHPLRILGRWNASLVEGARERDEDAAFDLELADNPDEAAESTFRWAIVMSIVALTATSVVGELLERHGIYRVPEAAIGVLAGAAPAVARLRAGWGPAGTRRYPRRRRAR